MFNWNYDNYKNTLEMNWMVKSQWMAEKHTYNLQQVEKFSSDTITE